MPDPLLHPTVEEQARLQLLRSRREFASNVVARQRLLTAVTLAVPGLSLTSLDLFAWLQNGDATRSPDGVWIGCGLSALLFGWIGRLAAERSRQGMNLHGRRIQQHLGIELFPVRTGPDLSRWIHWLLGFFAVAGLVLFSTVAWPEIFDSAAGTAILSFSIVLILALLARKRTTVQWNRGLTDCLPTPARDRRSALHEHMQDTLDHASADSATAMTLGAAVALGYFAALSKLPFALPPAAWHERAALGLLSVSTLATMAVCAGMLVKLRCVNQACSTGIASLLKESDANPSPFRLRSMKERASLQYLILALAASGVVGTWVATWFGIVWATAAGACTLLLLLGWLVVEYNRAIELDSNRFREFCGRPDGA